MGIKEDAEKILKDAVFLYTKIKEKNISNEEILAMLRHIIGLTNTILSDDKEAMKRIGIDLKKLFGDEEKTKGALQHLGIDFQKLFG